MPVGVSGSRNGMAPGQRNVAIACLHQLHRQYGGAVELHHGDCRGVDDQLAEVARGLDFRLVAHPPIVPLLRAFVASDAYRKPLDYLARDRALVDEVRILIACPDGPERPRSGTWYTINYAKAQRGLAVWVVAPNGAMFVTGSVAA